MTSEEQLRTRLRKIEAPFAGGTTPGERVASEAALAQIKARLAEVQRTAANVELQFSIADPWSRQLFVALARRYGAPQGTWLQLIPEFARGSRDGQSIAALLLPGSAPPNRATE